MSMLSKLSSLNLKTKIIVTVLLLLLGSIWTLTFLIAKHLEHDMTAQIEAEQFSTACYIADSIEAQVKLRLESLVDVASLITPELISNPGKLRDFLSQMTSFRRLFQSGAIAISKEGKGIIDYPMVPGRSTASYSELEYFKVVITTLKPAIGKPQIGRFNHKPFVAFAVPIFNRSSQLMGVLTASTLLSDPSLLGTIMTASHQGFPDRLIVVSPKYRLTITGSDPTRIMTPALITGVNPVFDKFMAGYEGSGIAVNNRGIRMFLTAKQIPTPGWFIRVGLPTEIVFAPIKRMKIWAYSLAIGLSMISSLLLWLVIGQTLKPLSVASKLIQDITDNRLPLQKIPVIRHDEVGQLLTSLNTHLDYRKQAEEALLESEEKYRNLFNNAEVGIFRSSLAESEALEVNRRFLDIVGMTREETIGKSSVNLWVDPKEREEMLKELLANGSVSAFEYKMLNKRRGEVRNCLTSLRLYREQGILEGSILDITDRKQAEKAVQESRALLNSVIEGTTDAIYAKDIQGRYILFNAAAQRAVGKTAAEVLGKDDRSLFPLSEAQAIMEVDRKVIEERKVVTYETVLTVATGQKVTYLSTKGPLFDASGNTTGLFGVTRDIMERKRVEEK
jgi:PAS domain S-box-containing protein